MLTSGMMILSFVGRELEVVIMTFPRLPVKGARAEHENCSSGKLIAEQRFPRRTVSDLVLRVARQLPEKGPEILVPLTDAMHAVAAEVERRENPRRVRDQQVQPILPETAVVGPHPRVPLAAERID